MGSETEVGTATELRELLEKQLLADHRARWGDSSERDALVDFARALGALGWTAPGWPVEIGGRGLSIAEQVACEEVFRTSGAPQRVSVYGVSNVGPTTACCSPEPIPTPPSTRGSRPSPATWPVTTGSASRRGGFCAAFLSVSPEGTQRCFAVSSGERVPGLPKEPRA